MRRPLLRIATALYLLAVAWITLNPAPPDPRLNPVLEWLLETCASIPALAWIDFRVAEFTGNVLMFVPLGVLGMLLLGRWRWWLVLVLGAATTLVIEFVQLFLPARFSDPSDLIANTLGTAVGIGVVALWAGAVARRAGG
ncbi:VanZ family protein [Leifsonia sp. NPDC080035]|uniref:VanZ family protein n=1 Tax=Leifsonia sp. NPDC080035 TaxID=3143936 RepID=A0AAU7GAS9_9MICO